MRSRSRPAFVLSFSFSLSTVLLISFSAPSTVLASDRAWIELYTGYATPGGGILVGRVHKGDRPESPRPGESRARRLLQNLGSLDPEPLREADVVVSIGKSGVTVRTDERGYFDVALPHPLPPGTVRVKATLVNSSRAADPVEADLPCWGASAGLGIITDVDDTLISTGVSHKLAMIQTTMTRSEWELVAFPGAPETMAALVRGAAGELRPLIYISGSPSGFHTRLRDFFARIGFPSAPMVLKRFSSEPMTDQMAYKWPHILPLVDQLPARKWICLGDSSEQDPEVYRRLAKERPGKVEAIYIHLVTDEKADSPRFAGMIVFRDWSEASKDLASRKYMQPLVAAPVSAAH